MLYTVIDYTCDTNIVKLKHVSQIINTISRYYSNISNNIKWLN